MNDESYDAEMGRSQSALAPKASGDKHQPIGFGFPHRAGRYRTGGRPFSSPGCMGCRCMEGFSIPGFDVVFPGCCWLTEPEVEVSTLRGAVSPRGTTVLVPSLLELGMYGENMMRRWGVSRMALAPRALGDNHQPIGLGFPHRAGRYRAGGPPFS